MLFFSYFVEKLNIPNPYKMLKNAVANNLSNVTQCLTSLCNKRSGLIYSCRILSNTNINKDIIFLEFD